jgi:glutamate 5-kinase
MQLLDWGIVPVVNENDTTATDEITFGDNDTLAAQVAVSLSMDRLVLLTDTDGLYTEHPSSPAAELIRDVHDHSLLRKIDTATPGSHWGSGGMRSKVIAAEMASFGGTVTHIARAGEAGVLARVMSGQPCGTRVDADGRGHSSFKLWLRYAKPATGVLLVDDGAVAALAERGASLLPIGIVGVEGSFSAGDAVEVKRASDGHLVAKGLVDHSAREVSRFVADRERARGQDEAIHRDRLVLIGIGHEPAD